MLLLPKGDVAVLREVRTRSQGERPLPQQQQRLVLRGNAADLRRCISRSYLFYIPLHGTRRRRRMLLMANRLPNASAVVRPRRNQTQYPRQSQNLHLMLLENQVQRKSGVGHRRRPEILTLSVSVSLLCVIFYPLVRICTCQIYRFPALSFTT
jgi:hypothetical protein